MFETPFLYGSGWDIAADAGTEPVIVLSQESNDKAFGGENSVGRTVSLGDNEFRVVGVLDDWAAEPEVLRFQQRHRSRKAEDAYIPFRWGETLELPAGRQHELLEEPARSSRSGIS